MTEVILDIKQWGNNLGVRLPAAIVREAGLQVHQRVKLTVLNGQVVISSVQNEPTLLERLAQFDSQKHGGEAMTTADDVGAERW
jgi:antitoxin MazE